MPEYYYIKEAAQIFRRHPRSIYRWLDEGFIHGKKVKGNWLIPKEEAERILADNAPKDE